MTRYLDTSLLVTFLTSAPRSEIVAAWIEEHSPREFGSSGWVEAELSSALSVKLRAGRITEDHRKRALSRFRAMWSQSFVVYPVTDSHFQVAARFCERVDVNVRSGDALHLAIAARHGATVCTLDRRLAEAGPPLGVETLLV